MPGLRVGILVDSPGKQQHLAAMVRGAGHQLEASLLSTISCDQLQALFPQVDAWVVDSDEESDDASAVESGVIDFLLEHAEVPIILDHAPEPGAASAVHSDWQRRMEARLNRLRGDVNLQRTLTASRVWILAASTGGPAAVKQFLSRLPDSLDVAFIYVQHIDPPYSTTLLRMMNAAGRYPASLAVHGSVVQRDSLLLVSAEQRMELLSNGTFKQTGESWGGCYAPSIDQLTANVARVYRDRCGLIVFTGMGDDGAASSRMIRQAGGQVWVQSPSSCTSDSMPLAVLEQQQADFEGDPEALAAQLITFMKHDSLHRNTLS